MTAESLASAALALPPDARAALAEALVQSLEVEGGITYAQEWAEEIEDRIAAYRSGEMQTIPLEEVLRTVGRERKQ